MTQQKYKVLSQCRYLTHLAETPTVDCLAAILLHQHWQLAVDLMQQTQLHVCNHKSANRLSQLDFSIIFNRLLTYTLVEKLINEIIETQNRKSKT